MRIIFLNNIVLIAGICCVCLAQSPICNDVYKDNEIGSEVVNAAISMIEATDDSNDSDHSFLRRLAFVETRDGHNREPDGSGIWAFDNDKLKKLNISQLCQHIIFFIGGELQNCESNFGRHFFKKPISAGVITRSYLRFLETNVSIPLAHNITGQADFWIQHYCTNSSSNRRPCTTEYFIDEVKQLELREGCRVNTDIIFVLDFSQSIGEDSFEKMKSFTKAFVEKMTIGRNHSQAGMVIFSEEAQTVFNLNTYTDKEDVLDAISNVHYDNSQRTNMRDALCALKYGFSEGNGGRPASSAVFRIAIIMTDGKSNQSPSPCHFTSVAHAAKEVNKELSPISIFVIGVTDKTDEMELKTIATTGHYTHIDSFDQYLVDLTREEHTDRVCRRASVSQDGIKAVNGSEEYNILNATLGENETYRYNLQIGFGITVNVCVSEGRIQIYASTVDTVPNPNSANYDFYLDLDNQTYTENEELCGGIVIDPSKLRVRDSSECTLTTSRKRSPLHKRSTSDRTTAYFSIVGKAKVNSFIVNKKKSIPSTTDEDDENTRYSIPSDDDEGMSHETENEGKDDVTLIAATSSSVLLIICFIPATVLAGYALYYYRKKKKIQDEDEYQLLPQSPDYVEY